LLFLKPPLIVGHLLQSYTS